MKPDTEHHVDQLVVLAKAVASEIETLKAEFDYDLSHHTPIGCIDFYDEVQRYEIELIKRALKACNGNQTRAAKLLHLKSTTLSTKMKHYGLTIVR